MQRRRNLLTFGVSLLALVMAISITAAAPISAASAELTRPVTVANTTSNPVPVTVGNDSSSPVVTQDVTGRTELDFGCNNVIGKNNDQSPTAIASQHDTGFPYTVPAGKRLIIESVSISLDEVGGGSETPTRVTLFLDAVVYVDFHPYGHDANGQHWAGTELIRGSATDGRQIDCSLESSAAITGTSMSSHMSLFGYLVPSS